MTIKYLLVLISRHCYENSFFEDKRAELAVQQTRQIVRLDHVEARLILVHRVENNLQIR
jgi:hypothetical protein